MTPLGIAVDAVLRRDDLAWRDGMLDLVWSN
jgi:hypothetical protein